jgi:hypothetical protein
MSAAVSGSLNIHNGHRLSQSRQLSMKVSTSPMGTGFPKVGSRQWRSQQLSQTFPLSAAVSEGLNIHYGYRLTQCRQPSMGVTTFTMGAGFPNVGSRQWRSQHPQWSQAFPMSAAINEGLNIHNGHRLAQRRQSSVEVSISSMVTGLLNVGSRQWRSQHPQWSQACSTSPVVSGGLNIHNGYRLAQCRQPSVEVSTSTMVTGFSYVGSRKSWYQHPQWSQSFPMLAVVNGGLNIHNCHRLSQCWLPSMEVSTSTMVTGFPNVGSRQWRSQHPQWSQTFPMSAAVSGGLSVHNSHRLSHCRQLLVEVST